jgi:hypothetical protein
MIQNTVQTLIDYVKDLSGQDNLSPAKAIRALNFGTDHLSVIKQMTGSKVNPDSSNHTDLPRTSVTTSDPTLSTAGGTLDEGELNTLRVLEVLIGSEYRRLRTIDTRDSEYEYLQSQTGEPQYFDIDGNLIRLLPVPNAAYTYRLTYGRVHPRYSATNLTQATGLLPNEEEYVALYAADRVMIGTVSQQRTNVRNEMTIKQREIEKMVALKDQSTSKRMRPKQSTLTKNAFSRTNQNTGV